MTTFARDCPDCGESRAVVKARGRRIGFACYDCDTLTVGWRWSVESVSESDEN